MSQTLNKLRKKRGFPVMIDEDTFFVRSLTYGELMRLDSLFPVTPEMSDGDKSRQSFRKSAYMIGCALCSSETGEPEIGREANETAEAWADRIIEEFSEVEADKIRLLSEAVGKLGATNRGKPVTLESLVKN